MPIHSRDDALRFLGQYLPTLRKMGVETLGMFGSFARDEVTEESDLDLFVTFDGPTPYPDYFDILFFVEDRIGRKVDLVTPNMLKTFVEPEVEKDIIYV